jgi:hypothetical protein
MDPDPAIFVNAVTIIRQYLAAEWKVITTNQFSLLF